MLSPTTTSKKKQSSVIIALPQIRANIELSPQLAIAAKLLIQKQGQYVNTFEFRNNGVASVSQCIARLITEGAIIDTVRKNSVDTAGNPHERIAHYILRGWI